MSVFKIIENRLEREGKIGIELLRDELTFQKHRASDRLYDGFYVRVCQKADRIVMAVMNNADYMWIVNDGKSGGVNASYQAIVDWALEKQNRGELRFTSLTSLNNFVNTVKRRLEKRYLTEGGEKVSARRYFFINITVDKIKKSGAKSRIEKDLNKQIREFIGYKKNEKPIKVAIS